MSDEVYNLISYVVDDQELWPSKAAFLREAVEHELLQRGIARVYDTDGELRVPVHEIENVEQLRWMLSGLADGFDTFSGRVAYESVTAVRYEEFKNLHMRIRACYFMADGLGIEEALLHVLGALVGEGKTDFDDEDELPPLERAGRGLTHLLQHRAPPVWSPKSYVENARDTSQNAIWRSVISTALVRTYVDIRRIVEELRQ